MQNSVGKRWSDVHEDLVQNMTLMDDKFMHEVFNDRKCVEAVLQEIFHDSCLKITDSWTQEQLDNFFGKGTKMDVLAQGMPLIFYNIEPQENFYDARPERARYYGSIIDTKILESGNSYARLPPVYVIFITDGDMFGEGKPIYIFPRTQYPNGRLFGDGSYIMYLNCRMQDDKTRLGRLMHDFTTADPEQIYNPVLRKRLFELKFIGKDGKSPMCKKLDKLIKEERLEEREIAKLEEREIARKESEKQIREATEANNREIARSLHADGIDDERIARYTKTSVEQVKIWLE